MPWEYGDANRLIDNGYKYTWRSMLLQSTDYIESILTNTTAGQFDACAMTSMDALTIPAAGGVGTLPP